MTKELLLRCFPVPNRITGPRFGMCWARAATLCPASLFAGRSWRISAGLASTPAESEPESHWLNLSSARIRLRRSAQLRGRAERSDDWVTRSVFLLSTIPRPGPLRARETTGLASPANGLSRRREPVGATTTEARRPAAGLDVANAGSVRSWPVDQASRSRGEVNRAVKQLPRCVRADPHWPNSPARLKRASGAHGHR